MKTLDCRVRKCPAPVVETRKLILAEPGRPLTVLVGDDTARQNVSRLAASLGYQVAVKDTDGGFALELTPGESPGPASQPAQPQGRTVVYVAADTMGTGNDELGRILLKNFLFTLNELLIPPDAILFVNSGVKLTATGSEVIEALEKLACNGVDIASCGLCLEFFGLKEQLRIGRATNMLDIVEQLHQAGRVIRP
jgi:selenium metabolism protein YedF